MNKNRSETIALLLAKYPNAFFVMSNGLTSREAAHFNRQNRCFYLLHAMGEALSVGIGLANALPNLQVVVIDGDGNALMGLSSWCLMPMKNLKYYILRNGCYATTGKQKIPDLPIIPNWCNVLDIEDCNKKTPNPPQPLDIINKAKLWINCFKNEK